MAWKFYIIFEELIKIIGNIVRLRSKEIYIHVITRRKLLQNFIYLIYYVLLPRNTVLIIPWAHSHNQHIIYILQCAPYGSFVNNKLRLVRVRYVGEVGCFLIHEWVTLVLFIAQTLFPFTPCGLSFLMYTLYDVALLFERWMFVW